MNDLLIDLGDEWGHILPLSWLENITHISVIPDNKMEFMVLIPDRDPIKITSLTSIKDIPNEKERLSSYANGLISLEDITTIVSRLSDRYKLDMDVVLSDTLYDLSELRKQWHQIHGKPYYKLTLEYDPDTDNMAVSEVMNDLFSDVPKQWLDKTDELEYHEARLIMAYETIERIIGDEAMSIYDGSETRGGMTTTIDMDNLQ